MGREARPAGHDADGVGHLSDLVDRVPDVEGVGPQREVGPVLLDCADAHDGHGSRLVLQPILEGWPGELPDPEALQLSFLRH